MSERNSAKESLLSYLDELLTDVEAPTREAPQPQLQPQPQPQPQPKPKPQQSAPPADIAFRELEREKRQQLQSLLNRQVTRVAPQPACVVTEEIAEPKSLVAPPVPDRADTAEAETVTTEALAAPDSQTQLGFSQSVNDLLDWAENGKPQWAQTRFDVLLFDVSGLTLAVPLIALGQIQPIGAELTPIFGQSDWFMGLLHTPLGQIRTVNTALFVMPEKYSNKFLETAKYVISIDGLPWGLAVDSVNQPITLDPSDVKWRTRRTSRPWLAGTVKSAMCALIDIPRMAALLKDSEKSHRSLA